MLKFSEKQQQARGRAMSSAVSRIGAYWELTKPRITGLVLVTTFSGMWVAAGGMPDPWLVFLTLLGTGLAAGSSSTLNNYIDRHVDAVMARTKDRPLPTGRVSPVEAMALGIALGGLSFALLASAVNLLAAGIAVGTIFFYVVLYTALLKRRSPWCTSIGGIPGAAPPLIGWAAVSGDLTAPAWVLFALMFVWQPAHFWALALVRKDEYARAGLPMLPVARGEAVTRWRMFWWNLALLPVSLLPWMLGVAGTFYLATAVVMGGWYMWRTIRFVRSEQTSIDEARRLFLLSILYLFVMFVAVFVDAR